LAKLEQVLIDVIAFMTLTLAMRGGPNHVASLQQKQLLYIMLTYMWRLHIFTAFSIHPSNKDILPSATFYRGCSETL